MAESNEHLEEPVSTPTTSSPADERHPFRPSSLVAGLLALAVAGMVLVDGVGFGDLDTGGAAAVLLIGAGLAWLLRAVSGLRRAGESPTEGPG